MKATVFFAFVLLFLATRMNAQETASQNMLTEPRFNFYKRTLITYNEYLNTNAGFFNTTNFRLLYPFGNKALNFRLDLPIVTSNVSNLGNQTGIGDIDFSIAYIPKLNDKIGYAIRGKIIIPTATESAFGGGKWVFIASGFLGHYWDSKKKWFSITTLEHQFSFAGQQASPPVNTILFENVIYYSFKKNWIGADATIRYSFELKGYRNIFAIEYGYKISPRFNTYIHPSIGFGSQKSYNNGIEIGTLIYF
ncbi:lipid A phosphoethanolamine transferase [Flavobacterium sp. W1B]|uniref:lipid A phosphoethanolamine transferase n=1 Tax=Flavobacterium sp. W1B TaxID=3394146 RepID=UPI0039BCC470